MSDVSKRPVPSPTSVTGPFWKAANERRLTVQYDPDAQRWQFYPRAASVTTGKRNLQWRDVSGRGSVYSFTITHIPMQGFEDKAPYAIGLIDLDEGVRILANLVNVDAASVQIGMRVKVCWERLSDDINYFAFEPEE